ncbi:hypothetical protein ASPWEDRAFT_109223 [Aspergillus wentii DTO 134E9]|uniref:Zn(2)-C6 fungal-type domain-containing protein n=1 Tax=Aspergillus wentii DTO 134E9 TaxID=1073089 RepID=A0A1L9RRN6_ASPWE|nr:uncharacterized protein ASPWEDRAFT_109223 [Aspergillus wentii DTO 134E9]KAI9930443.1 hypothetical protein MW887_011197 [Aspergillus wentii]OJJ37601.1 hypothetical protein ASPWEDRAFT_109223 [Aspergillus wentii DTO 134E9]
MDSTSKRRPYRSHKFPACDRCRRFKRRCTGGNPEEPCVLCSLQNIPCQFSFIPKTNSASRRASKRQDPASAHRQQPILQKSLPKVTRESPPANDVDSGRNGIASEYHASPDARNTRDISSMVVSPVITEDIQILEQYMSSRPSSMSVEADQRSTATPGKSVAYLKVPRGRKGLAIAENPGKRQKEILWQIMRPYANELVRLYFLEVHPAFPILDEQSFLELYEHGSDKISPALACEFFALTLTLWDHSDILKPFPKPDPEFIWNLAVEALQQDFLAPGLSTVYAVVLDMVGRPIFSVLGNTINNARTVALAQSLGLNRDPTHWKRSENEKALRIRLWWATLIHDRWSSFSHGIPPSITSKQYDVRVPVLGDLVTKDSQSEKRIQTSECFIHLCTLSVILGDVLPLVYDLKIDQQDIWRQISCLESNLDEWESSLPIYLQGTNAGYPTTVSGSSSLRVGYLSVRLLLCRIALHAASISGNLDRIESTQHHLSRLRKSAQAIVDYVCSLTKAQLQEFWLPYTAHHLILTVIILLRCTIESVDKNVAESCKLSLRKFWVKLQDAAENDGWDLASICISRCVGFVSKILDASSDSQKNNNNHTIENQPTNTTPLNPQAYQAGIHDNIPDLTGLVPDILPFSNPDLSFENQWGSLWDGLGWMGVDDLSSYEFNDGQFNLEGPI